MVGHFEIIFMEMWQQISHSVFSELHVEPHSSICIDESCNPLCVSAAARSQLLLIIILFLFCTSWPVPIYPESIQANIGVSVQHVVQQRVLVSRVLMDKALYVAASRDFM